MNYEEDTDLMAMICESNEEVRNSLYEKYSPLIDYYVKKYTPAARKMGLEINDLIQEANVGFTDALNHYDKEKNASLKTFIGLCIKRKLINYLEKHRTLKSKISKDTLSLDYEYDDEGNSLKELLGDKSLDPSYTFSMKEKEEYLNQKIKEVLSESEYKSFIHYWSCVFINFCNIDNYEFYSYKRKY